MPSFRARLPIGDLLPGHAPEEVMAAAEAALAAAYTVEAKDLEVVARVPRIVLRFTVPESTWAGEDRAALAAAARMRQAVAEVATTGRAEVLRRVRGRWQPVG
ncbi:hypothetical protein E7744_12545 [Citricoccus sp. SGAir0253]|uniref:hypothetical protein n=1 Tax=Citricoccus sp. SGAir0253 TaxID=2567881 RepID=UPI0010CD125F|nr:hypothetical protein [Citricoccus sp. SGAir0253]QCU78864.1 hypothetical protein E7744_12545 [Citricoccus sp. SGAir0253]